MIELLPIIGLFALIVVSSVLLAGGWFLLLEYLTTKNTRAISAYPILIFSLLAGVAGIVILLKMVIQ